MRTMIRLGTVISLAILVMATGCSRKKAANGYVEGDGFTGDTVIPGALYDEGGIPLTGEPFNLVGQKVEDVSFSPVYFGYDSYQLAPEEVIKIEQVADHMSRNPGVVLMIEGHCDERGSNEYNLALGEQRALSVRGYLVNLGIAAERIQSVSFGEERPAITGTGEAVWRLNRRGEFALYR